MSENILVAANFIVSGNKQKNRKDLNTEEKPSKLKGCIRNLQIR